MNIKSVLLFLLICLATSINAQQKVIQLYTGAAAGSENWNWDEKVSEKKSWNTKVIYNVSHPTLTVFAPEASKANGTAIIICPGGAFHGLSINTEGNDVAKWLVNKGVTCFVLKYRLVHCLTDDPGKEVMSKGIDKFNKDVDDVIPLCIADGRAAIAHVRKHATEYNISPDRIGIIGFSAGGTVTASAAFNYTPENRPDFVAPIYAYMPDSLQGDIAADEPPVFLVAATDDQLGFAAHAISLYNKWTTSKRSAELHLYVKGGHGFGMRKQNIPTDTWIDRFGDWLDVQGFLKQAK